MGERVEGEKGMGQEYVRRVVGTTGNKQGAGVQADGCDHTYIFFLPNRTPESTSWTQ